MIARRLEMAIFSRPRGVLAALAMLCASAAPAADAPERIVFVRHGEKPPGGLGQLDCRGLNRALALPGYFERTFGKPDAIFAPNPADRKKDEGQPYDYVRPLATIEPTAIADGLPVNTDIGFADAAGLQAALEAPEYHHALVFVAWEHKLIDVVARGLLKAHGGEPGAVPNWDDDDFDGVDVVTIRDGKASFARAREGLDGLPETCSR
jgi:hypothetical protein